MLQQFADWIVFDLLKIAENTKAADAVSFFIYDSIKILLLLLVITYFMGWLRYYLPIEKLRDFLSRRKLFGLDYFFAAIFGSITPFCSCSSIPLFVGFVEAGIPLGVSLSFLVTSPLINEVAVTLFISVFGLKITVIYLMAGILIGMISGIILSKFNLEKYLESYVFSVSLKKECGCKGRKKQNSIDDIVIIISKNSFKIINKIAPYVIVGIFVGALIHGYVPDNFFEKYITKDNPFAVPLAVILAVPLYSNASGVIPIMQSLVDKGIPMGTALAFMMAVVGLSFPEALILKRVMKWQLLLIFFLIVTLGIILVGYGFNLIF